jgi:undecaprenyl pyrophosphate phosphatase UppP
MLIDMLRPQNKGIADMTLGAALFIGVAQVVVPIPGTSRSGVTITAGRFLGFKPARLQPTSLSCSAFRPSARAR